MVAQHSFAPEADKASAKSEFRRALGQFPTGITIITTLDEQGTPVGMTVSSFNSVSQDPPLILWSIDKSALSLGIFLQTKHFTVNVLGKNQSDMANHFARRGADKFAGIVYSKGANGCPVLEDVAACLECKTWSVYEGGDHLIVVGEVLHYSYRSQAVPLVFSQSSYAVPVQNAPTARLSTASSSADSFLENHLLYLLWVTHALYSSDLYQLLMDECKVIPEEWRILTLLLDRRQLDVDDIARMTSQPPDDCRDTLARMQANDHLNVTGAGLVSITETGLNLANHLVLTANQHEQTITGSLEENQQIRLKQNLREILETLRHGRKPGVEGRRPE